MSNAEMYDGSWLQGWRVPDVEATFYGAKSLYIMRITEKILVSAAKFRNG
jgi:hypothetical protein